MIADGRSMMGCSLEHWAEGRAPAPRTGLLPRMARTLGATVPPLSSVADAPAVLARVDWGRWCADCPCGGAEMVWIAGPHQIWCGACGNADIGGLWRPVAVPDGYAAIAAGLDALPFAKDRNWRPGA